METSDLVAVRHLIQGADIASDHPADVVREAVFYMTDAGFSADEIARRLECSSKTIERHRRALHRGGRLSANRIVK